MIFQYYPDTDMLYIKLAAKVSTESEEVAPGKEILEQTAAVFLSLATVW